MPNKCVIMIDGIEVTFEITYTGSAMAGGIPTAGEYRLTASDGDWSGLLDCEANPSFPIGDQFTYDELERLYREKRGKD